MNYYIGNKIINFKQNETVTFYCLCWVAFTYNNMKSSFSAFLNSGPPCRLFIFKIPPSYPFIHKSSPLIMPFLNSGFSPARFPIFFANFCCLSPYSDAESQYYQQISVNNIAFGAKWTFWQFFFCQMEFVNFLRLLSAIFSN